MERCIYGVDINPLAVEFARVSLWVETLDPDLPFSFLDHKIKVGNSLVGCWLDRVLDYPLKAWEREGGDGKDGPRTQVIETFLKGEKVGNKRSGDGRIKQEMRAVIDSQFRGQASMFEDKAVTTDQVVASARNEYECLHNLPIHDTDEREKYYREHVEGSPAIQQLKQGMDEWCAVWFWPTDPAAMALVPTPQTFHTPLAERAPIVQRLAAELKFFHWELAFPDVFTAQRSGFDAMVGNPPWDVITPNSQEFFTEFDPLYRTYDKQAALRKQKEVFATMPSVAEQWDEYIARFKALANWARSAADPFDVTLTRGKEGAGLAAVWAKHRMGHVGFANACHPFRLQGSAGLNSYKMFAEVFWNLLQPGGRLGVILPTGIYSDFGTKDFREELLLRGQLEFLYAFQNEKRVFAAAHHSYKQTVIFATKGGSTRSFRSRFRMGVGDSPEAHEIPGEIVGNLNGAMLFTPEDIRASSPESLSLVELRTPKDLLIVRTIAQHSIRIGELLNSVFDFDQGIHLTSGSKKFSRRENWETDGYRPTKYGSWLDSQGRIALPLYQGAMFHHFKPFHQFFDSGSGRTNRWSLLPTDHPVLGPKYLIAPATAKQLSNNPDKIRFAFRDICRNTDERTFIGSIIPPFPCGNTVPTLTLVKGKIDFLLFFAAACSSLTCDYLARLRTSGAHINQFILKDIRIPRADDVSVSRHLTLLAARLSLTHSCFAPDWLSLKRYYPQLEARQWKHWWSVTTADRLRMQLEIEALCAHLFGLVPDEFDWIVRDDPTDAKGFYRTERVFPFRERLTGLAAAAFRALKDGKWSVECASAVSNDMFFEIIGIPEMTTGPDPIIRQREGCQRWHPEEFGPDDPRYGWTWDDCWKDAVAVLGSEKELRAYLDGQDEDFEEKSPDECHTNLFGEPLPPIQRKLF